MFDPILKSAGFRKIGELLYKLPFQIYWNSENLIQIDWINLDPYHVLWGQMAYRLLSITEAGETYVRDLNGLFQYLQSHFPELHISFSFHRNITREMIIKRLQSKGIKIVSEADLNTVKNKFDDVKKELSEIEEDIHFMGKNDPLINELFTDLHREKKHAMQALRKEGIKNQNLFQRTQKLIKEYNRKGYGASLLITASSTLQLSYGTKDFADSIEMIQKELLDQHHYIIRQKFEGGLLHVYLERMTDPLPMNQIQLAGMVLSPQQLKAMGRPVQNLYERVIEVMPAWPSEDIKFDGHVVDQKKLFGPKAVQIFFDKLDRHKAEFEKSFDVPRGGGYVGNVMIGDKVTETPFLYPPKPEHICITGPTGEGKTVIERVFVENVVILTGGESHFIRTASTGNRGRVSQYKYPYAREARSTWN